MEKHLIVSGQIVEATIPIWVFEGGDIPLLVRYQLIVIAELNRIDLIGESHIETVFVSYVWKKQGEGGVGDG